MGNLCQRNSLILEDNFINSKILIIEDNLVVVIGVSQLFDKNIFSRQKIKINDDSLKKLLYYKFSNDRIYYKFSEDTSLELRKVENNQIAYHVITNNINKKGYLNDYMVQLYKPINYYSYELDKIYFFVKPLKYI